MIHNTMNCQLSGQAMTQGMMGYHAGASSGGPGLHWIVRTWQKLANTIRLLPP